MTVFFFFFFLGGGGGGGGVCGGGIIVLSRRKHCRTDARCFSAERVHADTGLIPAEEPASSEALYAVHAKRGRHELR